MKKTLMLWKEIFSNPFEGFKGIDDSTKIFPPLLIVILLFIATQALMIPIMNSDVYGDAMARVQIAAMAEQGREMSSEQQAAMMEQMKSPMVRNINIVSALVGGSIIIVVITLITALILKLIVSAVKKDTVKFSLIFKILLFIMLITMIQSLVKMGVTHLGNWERALARITKASELQMVVQSPISLAAILDPQEMSRQLYFLVDYVTDIFNWIYYIFFYAAMRSTIALDKNKALIITVVLAVISAGLGIAFTFIGQ